MTRAANYAFLTAVYHDQLDDCRKLFAEARVDPSTASVDGVNALVVALALQVGVNYANDYSDGVRGTDDERRVGPLRLVALVVEHVAHLFVVLEMQFENCHDRGDLQLNDFDESMRPDDAHEQHRVT